MKRLALLGSSGSIGNSTLGIIRQFKKDFKIHSLAVNKSVDTLKTQEREFRPEKVAVGDKNLIGSLNFSGRPKILAGIDGFCELASDPDVDIVVIALGGSCALLPLLAAIDASKVIALANKEALVMAGGIIMSRLRQSGARLIPVDSEQSAIFQCIEGKDIKELKKVYLTASGGALYDMPAKNFKRLKEKDILNHPRWKMGRKITVDSATLMNKGLEVIEAGWLFNLRPQDIEVLIHREAIIHSMIEFIDGVVIAQLAVTDMAVPIQYALTYPRRFANGKYILNLIDIGKLTFEKPNISKFPCIRLALEASNQGGDAPVVLNAANEEAVSAFLDKKLSFIAIPKLIEKILSAHKVTANPDLEKVLETDRITREKVRALLEKI